MLHAALKTTLRALYRDKRYAALNLAGLSLAAACCTILGLYLWAELTYDRHHVRHASIFRVVNEIVRNGASLRVARTSGMLGPMLAEEHAEVRDYVRFRSTGDILLRHGDDAFYSRAAYFADDNVFDVFTHRIIAGDPTTALVDPSAAAVSRSVAARYFGEADPIGEVLTLESGAQWKIAAVFDDLPANSHLRYDVLFSFNAPLANPQNDAQRREALFDLNEFTYLVMPEGYDVSAFERISTEFFTRHIADNPFGATWRAWLQPLADVHLHSDVGGDLPTADRDYLYGFTAVGLFILLVASINYMNLATARAVRRAKEVGMRRILGAGRGSLALQFLVESVVLTLAAFAVGGALAWLALGTPVAADLLGKPLAFDLVAQPGLLAALLGAALLVGIGSGIYPALYLSSILPTRALVGSVKMSGRAVALRQLLVLVQFTIAVGVIVCTLLVAAQMRFVANRPLGFAKENRIIVPLRGTDAIAQIPAIENELVKNGRVLSVTASESIMGERFRTNRTQIESNAGTMTEATLSHFAVAPDFPAVMGMEIVAGRSFSADIGTDAASAVIVNEALVAQNGWTEPLGKRVLVAGREAAVIGVARDFNFRSLHTAVEPFAMYLLESDLTAIPPPLRAFQTRLLVVSIAAEDVARTLDHIRAVVERFDPAHPFEYRFVDESLDRLYSSEQRLMKLIGVFAAVCILVACLGVFGLAAFTTEQRTKELGIRKVLGASTAQLIMLLARSSLACVLLGAVAASLLAYVTIDRWLESFAYRAPIGPSPFAGAALLALGVAYGTIALQASRTARGKPVESLRHE